MGGRTGGGEVHFPQERMAELRAVGTVVGPDLDEDDEQPATGNPESGPATPGRARRLWGVLRRASRTDEPWTEEALRLELRGDLVAAAELHQANGSMLRAGHLFERAAREARD